MADIDGTSNDDRIQGTADNDTIDAMNGQDRVSGEGGDDLIFGGGGDDVLFGDNGEGTAAGEDATPLSLNINNLVSDNSSGNNNAQPGDAAVYSNIAQLEDGTPISGRLVLVETSDPGLNVDISGGRGFEILLNSGRGATRTDGGETATFRLEFFDPATGQPVALNSTATFNDLDRNSPGDRESVTLEASSFQAFGTASDTSLEVTTAPGSVTAGGTEANNPSDQDAWFSAQFSDRTFIEFTLETRTTQSGFTMNGDLIDDAIVTPIEPGNDTISGGSGQDDIFGQGGNDVLMGDQGDDELFGGAGNDILMGGQGQDSLFGGEGNDVLDGADGPGQDNDDRLFGGAGEDTLIARDVQDSLFGGTGNDTLQILKDGNIGTITADGGRDDDDGDIDTLDLLTGIERGDWEGVRIFDTGGQVVFDSLNPIPDQAIDNIPEDGRAELLDGSNIVGRVNFTEIENVVICFTPNTMMATPKGEVAVQDLRAGDRVFTRDNGIQEIAWAGSRTLSGAELLKTPTFQPVLVRAGSLGPNVPEADLLLSPNHRILMSGSQTMLHFDDSEVLASAKHLTNMDGVDITHASGVTYIHLMFAQHEVVLSNGAWTESFQPGDYSLKGMGADQRSEIVGLFPELADLKVKDGFGAARRVLKRHEAAILKH